MGGGIPLGEGGWCGGPGTGLIYIYICVCVSVKYQLYVHTLHVSNRCNCIRFGFSCICHVGHKRALTLQMRDFCGPLGRMDYHSFDGTQVCLFLAGRIW